MRTNATLKRATSVFVVGCLTFGQLGLDAFGAPAEGELSISLVETSPSRIPTSGVREVVVDVRNGDSPAAGASVEFSLPEAGPGGRFYDGSFRVKVQANAQGRARSGNIFSNQVPGAFSVAVQATQAGATAAGAAVPQQNPPVAAEPEKKSFFQKLKNWKVLAVLAGAGVAVIAVLAKGDPKPADVTVGVPTIGSPQ
jgi:hypothetical protein